MRVTLDKHFHDFAEFYSVYLTEHANRTCRQLHFLGSTISLLCLAAFLLTGHFGWLVGALAAGYGFAWIGHFRYEKNQPASLHHPVYAFIANWLMYRQMLTGQVSF
jgi:hypothetical protein